MTVGTGDFAVQCPNLLEWLLSRRLIPEDYARHLIGVEAKVAEATAVPLSDPSAQALVTGGHQGNMHYFLANEIYECLAKTPAGQSKTWTGAHTDMGTLKWYIVVDAYRRKNLKWANVGRLLVQNVCYEIPSLKKHIALCDRQISDCTQRQAELERAEAAARVRYESLLGELGVQGVDVPQELRAHAANELLKVHGALLEILRSVGRELAEYYAAFASYLGGSSSSMNGRELLPLLCVMAESHGDDVYIEDVIERVPILTSLSKKQESVEGLDAVPAMCAPQSLDMKLESSSEAVFTDPFGGIDWGIEVTTCSEVVGNDASWNCGLKAQVDAGVHESSVEGIDWGGICFDGLEVSAEGGEGETFEVCDSAKDGRTKLLENPAARELLLQDIIEAESFCLARCDDLEAGGISLAAQLPIAAQKSAAEVRSLAETITRARELLTGKATKRLLLSISSRRYVAQQVKRVELARAQCSKFLGKRAKLEKTKGDQAEEARKTHAELEKVRLATQRMQGELESELSAHFKANFRIVCDIA